ncbi:MAG: tetratricopeptide repeat protein [Saprospiraceae bacterium]|nr:tetratricopeptide repeat protein [Saprospiraceae bacterium]MDW8230089.1 tetratricopeptide repeat protein [Saprospiraceae bacterium]
MSKPHYAVLAAAGLVFLVLYFGLPKTPPEWKMREQSRAIRGEQASAEQLVESAKARLTSEERAALVVLEQAVEAAPGEAERIERLKELSGWWYARGYRGVAGIVAEQVAEVAGTDSAWSIAGATYYQALQKETDARLRAYYAERSIRAFESAASLAPQHIEHRVNIALVYAENPPADNPMKAVQLLRELEQKYPQNASVYNALGRLALKTGQWERAIERLEKALELDPENPNTPCLLLKAYENAGQPDKAAALADKCR